MSKIKDVDLVDPDELVAWFFLWEKFSLFAAFGLGLFDQFLFGNPNHLFALLVEFLLDFIHNDIPHPRLQFLSQLIILRKLFFSLFLSHIIVISKLEIQLRLLEITHKETHFPDHPPQRPDQQQYQYYAQSDHEGIADGCFLGREGGSIDVEEMDAQCLESDRGESKQDHEDKVDIIDVGSRLEQID